MRGSGRGALLQEPARPRLLPSCGSALPRMLEMPREGRSFWKLRSQTQKWHNLFCSRLLGAPCPGAGSTPHGSWRTCPWDGSCLAHSVPPPVFPSRPHPSASPPALVLCFLAFGWELGNAHGMQWTFMGFELQRGPTGSAPGEPSIPESVLRELVVRVGEDSSAGH